MRETIELAAYWDRNVMAITMDFDGIQITAEEPLNEVEPLEAVAPDAVALNSIRRVELDLEDLGSDRSDGAFSLLVYLDPYDAKVWERKRHAVKRARIVSWTLVCGSCTGLDL